MAFHNVVVGTPICEPWLMFSMDKEEFDRFDVKDTIFTEERFLPKILVECGVVKSVNEVRRNKPDLVRTLDVIDFVEIKWGKQKIFLQVGK